MASSSGSTSVVELSEVAPEWPCDLCSFLNQPSSVCAMCDTPREAVAQQDHRGGEKQLRRKPKKKKQKTFQTNLSWLRRSVRYDGGAKGSEGMTVKQWGHCLEDIVNELGGWTEIDQSAWIRNGNGFSGGGGRCMYGRAMPALVEEVGLWCGLGPRDLFVDVGSGMVSWALCTFSGAHSHWG